MFQATFLEFEITNQCIPTIPLSWIEFIIHWNLYACIIANTLYLWTLKSVMKCTRYHAPFLIYFYHFLLYEFRKKIQTVVKASARVDKFSKSDIIVSPSILSANFAKLGEQVNFCLLFSVIIIPVQIFMWHYSSKWLTAKWLTYQLWIYNVWYNPYYCMSLSILILSFEFVAISLVNQSILHLL